MQKPKFALPLIIACLVTMLVGTLGYLDFNRKAEAASQGSIASWITLRAVSSTDDTGLAAGGAKWSDVSSSMVQIHPRNPIGALSFAFLGTNDADEVLNWVIYAAKGINGPIEFVAYGTATLGLTQTGETTEFWADTISITNQEWGTTIRVVPGFQYNLGTGIVSGAGVAFLELDSRERDYWLVLISKSTTATGGCVATNYN